MQWRYSSTAIVSKLKVPEVTANDSPTNIILTSAAAAVAANGWFAKKYPKIHGKYVYVVR